MTRARGRSVLLAALLGVALSAAVAAPSAGAAGAAIELAGSARTDDGAPLAGARVELLPIDDSYAGARRAATGEPVAPLATAIVDRDGSYSLKAPGAGLWSLLASAPGRQPMELAALAVVEATVLPPAVAGPAVAAAIRVVDPAGKPIAGAVLQAVDEAVDLDAPTWRPGWRPATTGADGRVSLPLPARPGQPPGQPSGLQRSPLRWIVTAAGFAGRVVAIAGPQTVTLAPAAAAVALRVREPGGLPVANAIVATAVDDLPLAVTGEDGGARFTPPAGELQVLAADGRVWSGKLPPAPAGQPAVVTLPLAAVAAGRVVDAEDRRPLAGAIVASNADLGRWVLADGRGAYALPNPGGPKAGLIAWAAAHFRGDAARATAGAAPGSHGPTLVLPPGAIAAGWVVDPGRLPIAGAEVRPSSGIAGGFGYERGGRSGASRAAFAGRDGSFSTLLPLRGAWTLTATAAGFASRSVALPALAPRARRPPLTIVLDAGRAAIARVEGPDGAPVAGATVELIMPPDTSRLLAATVGSPRGGTGVLTAKADAKGVCRFQHLPAGRAAAVATKAGFAPAVSRGLAIAASGPATDLGTLRLTPGAALEGRVTDGRRPLAGASVTATISSRTSHGSYGVGLDPVTTGVDGRFRIADLQPGGNVDLRVACTGFKERAIPRVVPAERPLVVVLEKSARIAGRVIDESREAVAGARVRAEPEDHDPAFLERFGNVRTTKEDGSFEIETAPDGHVRLEVTAGGFESSQASGLVVPAGGTLDGVEVVMKRGAAISGTVTTDDGRPVAGAGVSASAIRELSSGASGMSFSSGAGALSDGDGAFRLEGVAAGRQLVTADHPDLGRTSQEVEVGAGEAHVGLRFASSVEVQGSVVDRGGAPVAGAAVILRPAGGGRRPELTASDDQGGFRFEHVVAGAYALSAARAMGSPASGRSLDLQVEGAPLTGLQLVLAGGATLSGTVLGSRPEDQATLAVEAQGPSGIASGELGADGSYQITSLAAGRWEVTASASGTGRRGQGEVTIADDAADAHLDIELGAGLTLRGTVLLNGQPFPGAQVNVQATGSGIGAKGAGAAARDVTDSAGAFRLEGLPAGPASLFVLDFPSRLTARRTLDLEDDQTIEVDLAAGGIAGSVVDASTGLPLADVTVGATAVGAATPGGPSARTSDALGHFGFDTLVAGSYAVTFRKPGYLTLTATVTVEAPGTAALDLALAPGVDPPAAAKP